MGAEQNKHNNRLKGECLVSIDLTSESISSNENKKAISNARLDEAVKTSIKYLQNLPISSEDVNKALLAIKKTFPKNKDFSSKISKKYREKIVENICEQTNRKGTTCGIVKVCDFFSTICQNVPNKAICKMLAVASLREDKFAITNLSILIMKGIGTIEDSTFANEVNQLCKKPTSEEIIKKQEATKQKIIERFNLQDLLKDLKK